MKVLPRAVVEQLGPDTKDYAKEDIIAGGYRLQLNDSWDGIPSDEVEEVRQFMEDAGPFLAILVSQAHKLLKALQKNKRLSGFEMDKLLGPGVYFSRMTESVYVVYRIRLTYDNVVFMDREESIYVPSKEYARPGEKQSEGFSHSSFEVVRWVGELHPIATTV